MLGGATPDIAVEKDQVHRKQHRSDHRDNGEGAAARLGSRLFATLVTLFYLSDGFA